MPGTHQRQLSLLAAVAQGPRTRGRPRATRPHQLCLSRPDGSLGTGRLSGHLRFHDSGAESAMTQVLTPTLHPVARGSRSLWELVVVFGVKVGARPHDEDRGAGPHTGTSGAHTGTTVPHAGTTAPHAGTTAPHAGTSGPHTTVPGKSPPPPRPSGSHTTTTTSFPDARLTFLQVEIGDVCGRFFVVTGKAFQVIRHLSGLLSGLPPPSPAGQTPSSQPGPSHACRSPRRQRPRRDPPPGLPLRDPTLRVLLTQGPVSPKGVEVRRHQSFICKTTPAPVTRRPRRSGGKSLHRTSHNDSLLATPGAGPGRSRHPDRLLVRSESRRHPVRPREERKSRSEPSRDATGQNPSLCV